MLKAINCTAAARDLTLFKVLQRGTATNLIIFRRMNDRRKTSVLYINLAWTFFKKTPCILWQSMETEHLLHHMFHRACAEVWCRLEEVSPTSGGAVSWAASFWAGMWSSSQFRSGFAWTSCWKPAANVHLEESIKRTGKLSNWVLLLLVKEIFPQMFPETKCSRSLQWDTVWWNDLIPCLVHVPPPRIGIPPAPNLSSAPRLQLAGIGQPHDWGSRDVHLGHP